VKVPAAATSKITRRQPVPANAPTFVKEVLGAMISQNGDKLPVSKFPVDGTYPSGTLNGKNATLHWKSPFGIPMPASSAANARSSARTVSFAPRFMMPLC
jgi:pyruvate-ferredoxin/flavodoxin oxidoreductase